jgi:hypothetical protein
VKFEQAKLLKENGFNEKCRNYYTQIGKQYVNGWGDSIEDDDGFSTNEYNPLFVFDYSDFNKKQVMDFTLAPEQWQVIEWLREVHQIDLQAICNWSFGIRTYRSGIIYVKDNKIKTRFLRPEKDKLKFIEFNSPQESYSAAIDYCLGKILTQNKR